MFCGCSRFRFMVWRCSLNRSFNLNVVSPLLFVIVLQKNLHLIEKVKKLKTRLGTDFVEKPLRITLSELFFLLL